MTALTEILTYLRRHLPAIIVVLVVALLTLLYTLGIRPGPGLTFQRTGTLILEGLPQGAVVYADESPRTTARAETVRLTLVPGSHSIIIDMPEGHPWNDVVSIVAGEETRAMPIYVPKDVPLRPLERAERVLIPALADAYAPPSDAAPLLLENGCARVTISGNRILAVGTTTPACTPPPYLCTNGTCEPTVVFAPESTIHAVLPLPGHDAALLVSYGRTVAVVELNPLAPQFFAPLYEGAPTAILPWKDGSFVLAHDAEAYEVRLP